MGAKKILIMGSPGTGKSTAARNLDPNEVFYICTDRKGLPLKNWKTNYKTILKDNGKLDLGQSNYFETNSSDTVITLIKAINTSKPSIKVVIIDTLTALMEDEYMRRIKEKGFEKFNDVALHTFNLIALETEQMRDDLTIIMTAHTQTELDSVGDRRTSFKVIGGNLVGKGFEPEARFNEVLYTDVVMENNVPKYYFLTQNDGKNTCRTSYELFSELRIPNDYKYVIDKIKEFEG